MLEHLHEFPVGSYLGNKVVITENQERRDNQQERLLETFWKKFLKKQEESSETKTPKIFQKKIKI